MIGLHVQNSSLIPGEYWEWTMCKAYGCTPQALAEIDADTLMLHLGYHNAEVAYQNALRKSQG